MRDRFVEFLSSTPQSNGNIHSVSEQVFIPALSHMKIANVNVGVIHQNVRIALQFSYQFAIFISVCNIHISLQFSRFSVQFLRGCLQFLYEFAIFHMSLQFSYQFAILTSQLQHLLSLICMDSMSHLPRTH
jgi:hypothetical protein